ncbi:MAG: (2Fe-2S)-binding protein [Rhodobacteraceae bacterium]|nr:(2Fe-2S)-binding protein [Paracoccaceae bacterium]
MTQIKMTVNGKSATADVPDNTLLSEFLRENMRLTGTHVGCDTSQCGACVVHVDGRAVKSCTVLAASLEGADVTTIEGIANGKDLHPMQAAFKANHGLQCGFCTPGMIMSGIDMVNRYQAEGQALTAEAIRHELEGNICRCTGYHNIVKSIEDAADEMSGMAQAAE